MNSAFDIIKSAVYFLTVLSVLVLVHEWGHFFVAKLCNMRVDDFSLFFGKRLVRLGVRNGTEYNIRSIPLGGFVKIAGMEPDDISNGAPIFRRKNPDDPTTQKKFLKTLQGLNEEALADVNFDNVSERVELAVSGAVEDGKLATYGKAELQTLLATTSITQDEHKYIETVLAADEYIPDPNGYNQKPLLQRAAVIFAGPFMSLAFGYLMFCVMGFTIGLPDPSNVSVGAVVPGKSAARAGIQAEDQIEAIDGAKVISREELMQTIQHSPGRVLHLTLVRGTQHIALDATPDLEKDAGGQAIGRLNVQLDNGFVWKKYPAREAIGAGTAIITDQVRMTLTALFTKQVRQINKNMAGPIGIATTIHSASKGGLKYVLIIGASLSVSLGIMNLLPIPILDGGHLLLLAIEGIRRRKLTMREVSAAQLVGFSIIGLLFLMVMYNDIVRLIPHK